MADPYLPPQPGSYDAGRNPRDPAQAGINQPRVSPDTTRPIPVANDGRGGFSTGIMVALAFVVVAILAAAFYRGSGSDDLQTVPASDTTIQNTVDPAPSAPADAPAADGTTATPDAVAPDAVAPDATAPDAAAPDATTGGTATPDAGTAAPATPAPSP